MDGRNKSGHDGPDGSQSTAIGISRSAVLGRGIIFGRFVAVTRDRVPSRATELPLYNILEDVFLFLVLRAHADLFLLQ